MPQLVVLEGGKERVYRIGERVTTLGRSLQSSIRLTDVRASRDHCEIVAEDGVYVLRDLGTPNGTLLNGEPARESPLAAGDVVRVGDTELRFEFLPEDQPAAPELPEPGPEAHALVRRRKLGRFTRRRRRTSIPPEADPLPMAMADLTRAIEDLEDIGGSDALESAAALIEDRVIQTTGRSLSEGLRQSRDSLLRLQEITAALNREHNLQVLLERIMDAVVELSGAERGFLLLAEEGKLAFRVARNFDREDVRHPANKISRSIAERVVASGRALCTADAQSDPDLNAAMSVADLKLRSILCLPFTLREETLGCIYLDNRFQRGIFTEADLDLLTTLAHQAAIAIETARLLEANRRREEELRQSKEQVDTLNRLLEEKVKRQSEELVHVREILRTRQEALETKYAYGNIIGNSPPLRKVLRLLDRVTDSQVPVLIVGESGTGKELVARAIHFNGPRRRGPFVSENCAAIPSGLFESTLFGHVRGSFTGAVRDHKGLFDLANGGTIFLDEIGEMPIEMQSKLLRVLQEGEVRPVGGNDSLRINVRILCASNRDLAELVKIGKFREDLLYRINVVTVSLPPLRQRREDIPLLVAHFIDKEAREQSRKTPLAISSESLRILTAYDWPGNIRELENELYRAATLSEGEIRPDILRTEVSAAARKAVRLPVGSAGGALKDIVRDVTDEVERQVIGKTLEDCGWVKTEAAKVLGISRPTLDAKISLHGLQPGKKRD